MSFLQSTGALQIINEAVQQGRGAAAAVLGQTYTVQRLTQPSPANGSVTSQTPVLTGFPIRWFRDSKGTIRASKIAIENQTFDLLCAEGTCDNRQLQLGDLFSETGYGADKNSVWTLVQARPLGKSIFVRTESNCAITRPMPAGGAADNQPTSGAQYQSGYGGIPKDSEWVLQLVSGFYSFTSQAAVSPASVQCGLQPTNRVGDNSDLGTPTDLPRERYVAYIPDIGIQLERKDRINFQSGDRYEIVQVYNSDLTGFRGNICLLNMLGL